MEFEVLDLGLIDFTSAWQVQKDVFLKLKSGKAESALIICSHYPVITFGRGANFQNLLVGWQELAGKKIKTSIVDRGGDITYHGPGQLTAYPIFDLNRLKKDIHWYLRQLEGAVIGFLSDFGVIGDRLQGLTGVWIGNKKIASIGIGIRNWISFHGLSINVKETDLENFGLIRPCGMEVEMTSMETILKRQIELEEIKLKLCERLRRL